MQSHFPSRDYGGLVDWSVVGEIVGGTKNMAVHANHGHHDIVLPVQKQGKDN